MINVEDYVLEFGDLRFNLVEGRIYKNGKDLAFSKAEFGILMKLLKEYPHCVTRDELIEFTSPQKYKTNRTIDVHIYRIRNKLLEGRSNVAIATVHGKGYYLTKSNGKMR